MNKTFVALIALITIIALPSHLTSISLGRETAKNLLRVILRLNLIDAARITRLPHKHQSSTVCR